MVPLAESTTKDYIRAEERERGGEREREREGERDRDTERGRERGRESERVREKERKLGGVNRDGEVTMESTQQNAWL